MSTLICFALKEEAAPFRKIARPKAPEDWRSPRRFARFASPAGSRQRLGLRRPSAAITCVWKDWTVFPFRPVFRAKTSFGPMFWRI